MNKSYLYYILFFISFIQLNVSFGQGLTCSEIQPFCAGNSALIFPNSNINTPGASDSAESGINYSCTTGGGPNNPIAWPYPAWYFLQIDADGDLDFTISQTVNMDGTGATLDVDFIAWGPFNNINIDCGVDLTVANKIDCSWSASPIETMNISSAMAGDVYVVMITNFSQQPGFILLQQTNAGEGSTDCSIVNTTNFCDGDITSLDATSNKAVIYQWFQDGILLPETGPILNNVVAPSAVYTANAFDNSNNVIIDFEFIVEFHTVPTANPSNDLLECDDDNDGFFAFDLSANNALILSTQDPAQFRVTYYDSQVNADSGTNALSIPYTNTSSPQIIYARIENNDNFNCFDTTSFTIELFDTPTANVADDILECDDNNDAFFTFDLSVNDALILGTQDATQFSITYHDSQANADLSTNALVSPYTNTSNPQTIFARIENNVNTDCFDTTTFTIEVFDSPIITQVTNLLICDDDNDGFWPFNLDQQTAGIIGTQNAALFTVTYHQTQTDADNNTNSLTSPYTNQNAYQEEDVFIRIENNANTNCFVTGSFFIDVFEIPTANTVIDYELCDNANDGDDTNEMVIFDLSTRINEVLGTQSSTDFEVKFYFTQADADAAVVGTEIFTPLQNTSNPQTIVARIENLLNVNCFDTTTFNLIVNPLPVIASLVELKQCDDDTDGFTEFNLTESNELFSTNYLNEIFTYHTLLVDAENGLNAISNETNYLNINPSASPDILYVRIENADGCYRTSQLNLIVSTTQIPQNFQLNYSACDDELIDGDNLNGVAAFDFSDADAQISNLFPIGQTITITYFENLDDALQESNAISDISNHRNDASPFVQTIFVRVDSDVDNACLGLGAHITLTVNPLPIINLDDEYLLCVNTNGTETINFPILETGLSNLEYSFVWSLENTVLTGFTASSYSPIQGGNYSVLVTNITSGCENTDTTLVNESEPPTVTVVLTTSAFADNQIIEATANGSGDYEFSLDNGLWQDSGVFENVSPGEHIVTARDKKGCGLNSVTIIVIDFPKFFTPNGDGFNDTWNILGIDNQPNAKIFIFDRYGKLLKQINPSSLGWDGTFNGKPLMTNDYWFTVEFIEPKDGSLKLFKSHFTLKR